MAAYEVLLLNTAIPQIQAAQSGDTYVVPRDIAINATAIISANSATDALRITQTGAGNALVVEDSANPDSTPFVVTAAGDVGVGTSSPAAKLQINGNDASGATGVRVVNTNAGGYSTVDFQNSGASGRSYSIGVGGNTTGSFANAFYIYDATAAATRLTLDSSGNLGLGVTPSAWAVYKSFDSGSCSFNTAGVQGELTSNGFFNASSQWIYKATGFANRYVQNLSANGVHAWFNAPSGNANDPISFTQAMTLDASGNLGVGTTSPSPYTAGSRVVHIDGGANAAELKLTNNTSGASGVTGALIQMSGNDLYIWNAENSFLSLGSNNTERARITSEGYFKAKDSGSYAGLGASFHEFNQSIAGQGALVLYGLNASTTAAGMLYIETARNTTNNTYYAISYYNSGAAAYKFRVADSGDVTNTNGTYGTISDAKMKTDIVDAGSQWSDIKALRFRKFKMKDDPSGLVQLGVVAQEVEQTSPGLVDEHTDRDADGNDLGTTTKSVKTSVLLMKAAVALQEAMARIETLEAEVAALKGA